MFPNGLKFRMGRLKRYFSTTLLGAGPTMRLGLSNQLLGVFGLVANTNNLSKNRIILARGERSRNVTGQSNAIFLL